MSWGQWKLTKKQNIVTNHACFCQTSMLTPKITKETIENLFQFDLDHDKSWNYLWYCYVRTPVHPLPPLSKRQGEVPSSRTPSSATLLGLLQPLRWCCVDCVIHHERVVCEEQHHTYMWREQAITEWSWRVISDDTSMWTIERND